MQNSFKIICQTIYQLFHKYCFIYMTIKSIYLFMWLSGYCFSASLPPLLSMAAIKTLEKITEQPQILDELRERSIRLHKSILESQLTRHFVLQADEISPLKHLYLKDKSLSHTQQQNKLKNIVDFVSNSTLSHFNKY